MTEHQVQNVGFRVELIKVFNAIFAEAAEMMDLENGKYTPFCKQLGKAITKVATMSNDASDETREGIRLETREAFLDLIEQVKHFGLMAIYEAGDPRDAQSVLRGTGHEEKR